MSECKCCNGYGEVEVFHFSYWERPLGPAIVYHPGEYKVIPCPVCDGMQTRAIKEGQIFVLPAVDRHRLLGDRGPLVQLLWGEKLFKRAGWGDDYFFVPGTIENGSTYMIW